MAADSRNSPEPAGPVAESRPVTLHAEEETAGEPTPRKDLASAILLAIISLTVMAASAQFEVPDTRFTAPGLLPFVTALALFGMSLALAFRAVRAGALRRIGTGLGEAIRAYFGSTEERRAWLLASLVLIYVVLVAQLPFELAVPVVGYALSAYEVISIFVITLVLKLFWRASVLRCFLVSLIGVELLALAFRFGFDMLMPEVF